MEILNKYNEILDEKAELHRAAAAKALEQKDQRTHSIELMQAGMLGDMLKQIGMVEHKKIRPGLMQKTVDLFKNKEKECLERDDFDQADRNRIQGETVQFALDTLRKLEAEQ